MAQITVYLPDEVAKRARKAAKSHGTSVSRWIADQLAHKLDDAWPKEVLDAAGAIPDFPGPDQLRKDRLSGPSRRSAGLRHSRLRRKSSVR